MKKLLLILFILPCLLFGQDFIVDWDGNKIQVKVIEIDTYDIKYKKYNNIEGPIYTVDKRDYIKISYENGTEDVLNINRIKELEKKEEKVQLNESSLINKKTYISLRLLPSIAIFSNLYTDNYKKRISYNYNILVKHEISDIISVNAGLKLFSNKYKTTFTFGDMIDPQSGSIYTESGEEFIEAFYRRLGPHVGASININNKSSISLGYTFLCFNFLKVIQSNDYNNEIFKSRSYSFESISGFDLDFLFNIIDQEKFKLHFNPSINIITDLFPLNTRLVYSVNFNLGLGISFLMTSK